MKSIKNRPTDYQLKNSHVPNFINLNPFFDSVHTKKAELDKKCKMPGIRAFSYGVAKAIIETS